MFLKLLGLIKKKALMIKINIISNHKSWYRYIKNPSNFIEKRIKNLNKKFKKYQKKIFFVLYFIENKEIKNLNKNLEKKDKSTDVLSFPFYKKR